MSAKPYGIIKQGIVQPHRFPWGGNKDNIPPTVNDYGIETYPSNFYTAVISAEALKRNTKRRFLQIENRAAANNIVYQFDGPASLIDGTTLIPGEKKVFDTACPIGSLHIIGVGAGDRVSLTEGY